MIKSPIPSLDSLHIIGDVVLTPSELRKTPSSRALQFILMFCSMERILCPWLSFRIRTVVSSRSPGVLQQVSGLRLWNSVRGVLKSERACEKESVR